jgi:hypothetical protein
VDVNLDDHLADEDDLDLPCPPEDDEDTVCEAIEFMGDGYRSLAHYFVGQLEDHVAAPVQWILTCLDMAQVQRRFEGNRYRYVFENGAVYRTGLPGKATPRPPAGDDPPGPWMPTRS